MVLVEILPSAGLEVVSGSVTWTGPLLDGRAVDLPITVRVTRDGQWTLGARVTSVRADETQVSGTVVYILSGAGSARFHNDTPFVTMLSDAATQEQLRALGVDAEPAAAGLPAVEPPAVATSVAGTVHWRSPEGRCTPSGGRTSGSPTAPGPCWATRPPATRGPIIAAVNADSVKVTVYTQDFDNIRAIVFPLNQPTQRYILEWQ